MRSFRIAFVPVLLLAVVSGAWLGALGGHPVDAKPAARKVYVPQVSRGIEAAPSSEGYVLAVDIKLWMQEPSIASGGSMTVTLFADATFNLPYGTVLPNGWIASEFGNVTYAPHPVDAAKCEYSRVWTRPELKVTVSERLPSATQFLVDLSGLEWHYEVHCPDAKPIRFPAYGEESLTGWLGLILPPSVGGPLGAVISTPAFSGTPECVKRQGTIRGDSLFGKAEISVVVYQAGPACPFVAP